MQDEWVEYPMNAVSIKRIWSIIHRSNLGDLVLAQRRDSSGAKLDTTFHNKDTLLSSINPICTVKSTFGPKLHQSPPDNDDGVHVKYWGVNHLHGMLDIFYCVDGVKDSPYEGFKFDLCLTLNAVYPLSEIRAHFDTGSIPYHPNIHPISGRVCADVLTQEGCSCTMGPYKTAVLIRSMLGDFNLFSTPDLPFLNNEAAALLANQGVAMFGEVARAKCLTRAPRISVWE